MTCPKCAGLLVHDSPLRFQATDDYTVEVSDARTETLSRHCLNCGLYMDLQSLQNRRRQADERKLIRQAEQIALRALIRRPFRLLEQLAAHELRIRQKESA